MDRSAPWPRAGELRVGQGYWPCIRRAGPRAPGAAWNAGEGPGDRPGPRRVFGSFVDKTVAGAADPEQERKSSAPRPCPISRRPPAIRAGLSLSPGADAYYEERYPEAIERAREAYRETPWPTPRRVAAELEARVYTKRPARPPTATGAKRRSGSTTGPARSTADARHRASDADLYAADCERRADRSAPPLAARTSPTSRCARRCGPATSPWRSTPELSESTPLKAAITGLRATEAALRQDPQPRPRHRHRRRKRAIALNPRDARAHNYTSTAHRLLGLLALGRGRTRPGSCARRCGRARRRCDFSPS